METRNERLTPFKPVHAGSILKEELRERGLKQKDFATLTGMKSTHLSELLSGKRDITEDLATKLGEGLGIPATVWLSLQKSYEQDCMAIRQRDEEESQAAATEIAALACDGKATEERISLILGKHGLWRDTDTGPQQAARFVCNILHELRHNVAVL